MQRITESTVPNKGLRVPEPGRWTTGLFECFISIEEADAEGCEWVVVFPSVMHARMANYLRGDNYRLSCCTYALAWAYCAWLVATPVRRELRRKYDLPQEPCSDTVAHLCCSPCAVWQEYRELEAREGMHFYTLPSLASLEKGRQAVSSSDRKGSATTAAAAPDAGPPPAHQAWGAEAPAPSPAPHHHAEVQEMASRPPSAHPRDSNMSTLGTGGGGAGEGGADRPSPSPQGTSGTMVWRRVNRADSYRKRSSEVDEEAPGSSAPVPTGRMSPAPSLPLPRPSGSGAIPRASPPLPPRASPSLQRSASPQGLGSRKGNAWASP